MQNRKTNTNPSPDPNARIQKFIHYMAIATFAIAALCDSGLSPYDITPLHKLSKQAS